jgi:hypothetical protein
MVFDRGRRYMIETDCVRTGSEFNTNAAEHFWLDEIAINCKNAFKQRVRVENVSI